MRRSLAINFQRMIITAIMVFGVGQGCGLLDAGSNGAWIDIPDQTVDFDLSADTLKQPFKQWLEAQGSPYNEIDPYAVSGIPAGININQTFTAELPPQNVDLSTEPDLKPYVDAKKITGVKIKYVTYNLTSTANVDLPSVDLYMDTFETTAIGATSTKVATIPSIKSGQQGNESVEFTQGGREAMSNYFLAYQFTILGRTDITINTDVDKRIPSGNLTGTVIIGLSFRVNPL